MLRLSRSIWFFILHFLGEHIPLSLMMYYQITSSIRYKKIQQSGNPLSSVEEGKEDDTFFLIMNQQRKKKAGGDGDDENDERQHTDLNHSLVEVKEEESEKTITPKKGGYKIKSSAKTPVPDNSSLRSSEFGLNNKESVLSRAYPSLHEN